MGIVTTCSKYDNHTRLHSQQNWKEELVIWSNEHENLHLDNEQEFYISSKIVQVKWLRPRFEFVKHLLHVCFLIRLFTSIKVFGETNSIPWNILIHSYWMWEHLGYILQNIVSPTKHCYNLNNIMIPLEKQDITNIYKMKDPCILRHRSYGAARQPPPTTHLPSSMIWMWGEGGSHMYVCEWMEVQ